MNEEKNKKAQEILAEYKRRMDVLRNEQAELVRSLIDEREKKEQEKLISQLNA